jgi:hypothetical protein
MPGAVTLAEGGLHRQLSHPPPRLHTNDVHWATLTVQYAELLSMAIGSSPACTKLRVKAYLKKAVIEDWRGCDMQASLIGILTNAREIFVKG